MYHTSTNIRDRNTSMLLMILIVIVGFALSVVMLKKETKVAKGNKASFTLDRFEITDITSSSIGLFVRTRQLGVPAVYFGTHENNITTKMNDIRDTADNQVRRYNHVYKIDNLLALTEYYIKIDSLKNNKGEIKSKVFKVKTSSVVRDTTNQPVYGTLVDILNNPVADAVVLVKIKEAHPLLSITKSDGTFLLSTCCVTNLKDNENKKLNMGQEVTIEFLDDAGDYLQIQDTLGNISPFSNSIVYERGSKTINNIVSAQSLTPTTSNKQMILGAQNVKKDPMTDFEILYPTDIGVIPGNIPLIKGIGIPGKIVTITIDKNKETKNTVINPLGVWSVTVSKKILAGTHELTAESTDKLGNKQVRSRKFTIGKSGEQVLGSATGSATITPIATSIPVITPVVTATVSATIVPTTPIITPLLPAGSIGIPSLAILSFGLILSGLGMMLVF